ncbi:MAG TPA: carboxylesterase family protein [Steroidobacteraceae bacterium]|nr:carboxylesterase family protein [Steroidobacteraceae bacterium]
MGTARMAFVAAWVLAAGGGVARADAPPAAARARVDGGVVEGVVAGGVIAFKGIPFAAPPVGANRWRAPQPVLRWAGLRKATDYGPDCMQVPFPGDAAPLGVTPAEDCLYLNVWRPAKRGRRRPVMVWIYGGGFVNGGSSPPVYDGSAFARDDIVLVSFNYRLGNFGFFAHPALSAEQRGQPLGNYAYMDQITALRWVKRNIAAFGGDPSNVTIFGESAGGISVHALLLAPAARGLFQKAIIESGAGDSGVGGRRLSGGTDSAQNKGLALAAQFGIRGEGPAALAGLRALTAEQLRGNLNMGTMGSNVNYVGGPILGGYLERGSPLAQYARGEGARVPVMVGANSSDLGFVFMGVRSPEELYARFGPDAERARQVYAVPPGVPVGAVAFQAGGDQMMVEPARRVARLLSARGQPVYEFRFSYVAESLRKTTPGAGHATEIPFVFDTVAARYGRDLTAADEATARAVHAYWVAFARSGKPAVPGLPEWPAYDARKDVLMNFTDAGPVAQPDAWKDRLDLAQRFSARQHGAAGQTGK